MSTNWAILTRTYLAHRDPTVLEQAIAAAQEQEVVALLKEFQKASQVGNKENIEAVVRCAGVLHESLHMAGRIEEALTIILLHVDLRVRLVELYNWFPVEQQLPALQMGLENCDIAIDLTSQLNDFPCVALYWAVAGDGLRAARHLDTARTAFEKALAIYHSLYHQQPQVYESNVAATLNNLGIVLEELQERAQARQAFEEALTIYQRLAAQQPQVYEPDVAITLNNLGIVLEELQEWAQARQAYQEAIAICERHRLWVEGARIYHNLGRLEEVEGHTARALELFEACVEYCEQGLHQLAEREHRDLFKGQIERAYDRLIEHYARLATANGAATLRYPPGLQRAKATAKDAAQERLVGLLEALRHIETLAGFGATDGDSLTAWQEAFHDLLRGTGDLSGLFRAQRCALLWVHATPYSVVFVTLAPGECRVAVAEQALMDTFWGVFAAMHNAIEAWRQNRLRAPDYEVHGLNATAAHIPAAAEAVYHQLPDGVQALLTSDDYGTIFLAPCGETVNLPWELVRVPECQGSKEGWTYVGLRRLLPRIQGLGALREVLMRQPQYGDETTGELGDQAPRTRGRHRTEDHGRTKRAVVVGNPLHTEADPLLSARKTARTLAARLRRHGFQLAPHGAALLDTAATVEAVEAVLHEPFVLWTQMSHGAYDAEEHSLYLLLAGDGKLSPQQIAWHRWTHHPIVHYDCCLVGATLPRGGGRFDGHPTAALLAGASCVLSSVHPVFDRYAAEFSAKLYAKVLDSQNPLPLGVALLHTRQEMGQEYADNPLVWAMTVLWGNPWVHLA